MGKYVDDRLTDIIINCLSEREKREIVETFDRYYKESNVLREKCLEGDSPHLKPVVSINFGWVGQLVL